MEFCYRCLKCDYLGVTYEDECECVKVSMPHLHCDLEERLRQVEMIERGMTELEQKIKEMMALLFARYQLGLLRLEFPRRLLLMTPDVREDEADFSEFEQTFEDRRPLWLGVPSVTSGFYSRLAFDPFS